MGHVESATNFYLIICLTCSKRLLRRIDTTSCTWQWISQEGLSTVLQVCPSWQRTREVTLKPYVIQTLNVSSKCSLICPLNTGCGYRSPGKVVLKLKSKDTFERTSRKSWGPWSASSELLINNKQRVQDPAIACVRLIVCFQWQKKKYKWILNRKLQWRYWFITSVPWGNVWSLSLKVLHRPPSSLEAEKQHCRLHHEWSLVKYGMHRLPS